MFQSSHLNYYVIMNGLNVLIMEIDFLPKPIVFHLRKTLFAIFVVTAIFTATITAIVIIITTTFTITFYVAIIIAIAAIRFAIHVIISI